MDLHVLQQVNRSEHLHARHEKARKIYQLGLEYLKRAQAADLDRVLLRNAARCFAAAIEHNRKDARPLLQQAYLFLLTGNGHKAVKYLREAQRLLPAEHPELQRLLQYAQRPTQQKKSTRQPQQTEAPKAPPPAERPVQSQAEVPVQPTEDMQELVADLGTEALETDVPELEGEDTGLDNEPLEDLDDLAEDLGVEIEESEEAEGETEELSEADEAEEEEDEEEDEVGDKPEGEGQGKSGDDEEEEDEDADADSEDEGDDTRP